MADIFLGAVAPTDAGRRRGFARIQRERTVVLRGSVPDHVIREGRYGSGESSGGGGAPPAIVERESGIPEDSLRHRLLSILQPPALLLLAPTGPMEWPAPLFPYQRDGVQALLACRHLLLGDEMGLGKTIQAIVALRILHRRREAERSLIVVPAGLCEQWQRELSLWAPDLRTLHITGAPDERRFLWEHVPVHVTVVSYDTLRGDIYGPAGERVWDVVVLDEAQRIKNRNTDAAHTCKRLRRRRSWALTGTPLENREADVTSILEFVADASTTAGRRSDQPVKAAPVSGPVLRARLGELQLRRRKRDVLADLPPKIVTDLLLPLHPEQRLAYDEAEQEGILTLKNGGRITIENVLTLISRLKQICNFDPRTGASSKMDDLRGRIEELAASESQSLIFSQYVQSAVGGARRIARELSAWNVLVYAGDTAAAERRDILQRFQSDPRYTALVVSLKAGGQGLNLQNASYVFHFDRWWNPAVEHQAEDRAHRLGQRRSVNVYRYIAENTIEERIDNILRVKRDLFARIVEGATLDISQLLTKREIFGLFGLEP